MAARLYESDAHESGRSWTLLRSFEQATQAHLEAQRLSGTRTSRVVAGFPLTTYEYRKAHRAWLVEVDIEEGLASESPPRDGRVGFQAVAEANGRSAAQHLGGTK